MEKNNFNFKKRKGRQSRHNYINIMRIRKN